MAIDNTSRQLRDDPVFGLLFLAESMGPGGSDSAIRGMEKRAQQQLVGSDRLPSDCKDLAAMQALGFTFGEPDPGDPLFMPATLPEGWKRQGSGHDMWSHVVDQHGRRRVAMFFKGAFYDRRAFMRLESVSSYASSVATGEAPLVLDDWATRDEMLAALREEAATWRGYADRNADLGHPESAAEDEAYAAKYEAVIAKLEAEA